MQSLQDTLRCSTHGEIGEVIAITLPYMPLPTEAPIRTRIFYFWFTSDVFLNRPVLSNQDSYVPFLQRSLQAKVLPERTTYRAWGVPWIVPSSVSSRILRSDVLSRAQTSGTPKKGMLRNPQRRILEQGRPALLHWVKRKESTGLWSSATKAWESSRSCHRTSNNQPLFTSLEIP